MMFPADDPWPYGIENNRKTLEPFLAFCHEQGVRKAQACGRGDAFPKESQLRAEDLNFQDGNHTLVAITKTIGEMTMKIGFALVIAAAFALASTSDAAEIRILASGASKESVPS